ncbi:MAG: hypothetical protein EOR12_27065 [Mesorhizobium sp.]|uniref:hypothetical protein n=1 Tax=Mesorhizobium sp. TaxID=1871066 RepID=UPI000FEA45AE|nr:hypothetical protein [Mesorhizobium sp.]RWP84895.1 MAG: hypothetical protein EOR12_27065 [Mesorhizobium sp.]
MLRTALLLVLMTTGASAQQIIDKSGGDIPETAEFVGRITKNLLDPASAQIRSISRSRTKPDMICSFLNAKNAMGGYMGFHIAAIDMKTRQRFIYHELVDRYGADSADNVISFDTGCPQD